MIKRTLYFSSPTYLSTKEGQLIVKFENPDNPEAKVPIEDIGVIILDADRLTLTHRLIGKLLDNNVALVTCDEKHMPQGLLLNLNGNTVQQERYKYQINASQPLNKNLWQQTIKAKIRNQAAVLKKAGKQNLDQMLYWEDSVKSGDPDNYEGRAAAFYWQTLFSDTLISFKRDRFGYPPNNLLNYGYAILRATVARSLLGTGLMPLFGIKHRNKYNDYPLADDIMEPYRPFVDLIVKDFVDTHYSENPSENDFELSPEIKKNFLQIPVIDVVIDGTRSPLMNATVRTTASLYQCFEGSAKKILYPTIPE